MRTLDEDFYKVAAKFKDKVAASYKKNTLTYEQLNVKSNQLAHLLRSKINVGDIICISLDRSLEMLIAQLAILKSGGTYLCIDPTLPKLRILKYLEDTKAKVLISSHTFAKKINFKGDHIDIFNLNDKLSTHNLDIVNKPENIAYIIYTSGSTGRPKGVLVPHEGIINHVYHYTKEFNISPSDRIAQFANYVFDASVSEIMLTLLNGAQLYIIPEDIIYNYEDFEDFLNKNKISIITLPPPYLAHLRAEKIHFLRVLITAGSPTNHKLVKIWIKKAMYVNAYGPTETSIGATTYICNEKRINNYKTIPIGIPISNFYAYILGPNNNFQNFHEAEVGTSGELCIGGIGVAKGYLNSPDLTVEKFIEDPIFNEKKIYKTGDIVEKNQDGLLEFIGRADEQVKIRGYRVELGEIRNIILHQKNIKDCHLMIRLDKQKEPFICCYVVAEKDINIDQLRKYLLKQLPQYMLPSYFIKLKKLPLNSSGKVDKEKLPSPLSSNILLKTNHTVLPKKLTVLQEKVTAIWQELLGIDNPYITSSFFALGGDSLKAISLVSTLREKIKIKIGIKEIFAHDTLQKLIAYIESITSKEHNNFLALKKEKKPGPYPLTSAQKRLYFVYQMFPDSLAYNEPLAYIIKGEFNKINMVRIEKALKRLIKLHEGLRTGFELINNIPKQVIHKEANFSLLYQKQGTSKLLDEQALQLKIIQQVKTFVIPFDLKAPPLMRAKIISLDPETTLFLLDIHHIIIDGISIKKFIKDFNSAINYPSTRVTQKFDYIDYTKWHINYLKTKKVKEDENYWLKIFDTKCSPLNLSFDYSRPARQSFIGNTVFKKLDSKLSSQLSQVCIENSVSLYMLLLACFYVLLGKYSSQEDLVIGCPVANRPLKEFNEIFGVFINILPIRGQPKKNMTFSDFLKEVKHSVIMALEHQDCQFDILIKKLNIERDASRNSLFDVIFTMQENHDLSLNLGNNLQVEKINIDKGACFADIVMEIEKFEEDILIKFQYCSKLFSESTAKNMLRHYETILRDVISSNLKNKTLCQINLFSHKELDMIVRGWNDTRVPFKDRKKPIPEVFERHAKKFPHKTAMVAGNSQFSYEKINRNANKLAHFLHDNFNVSEGTFVALIMERSIKLITSILAILKTGAAYVPIDPNFPIERVNYILKDANIKFVLTHKSQKKFIHKEENTGLVYIDVGDTIIDNFPENNLNIKISPEQIAYVIYTSGSTGYPKGVLVEHQGVINTLCVMKHFFPLEKEDKYLLKTNYIFDVSLTEICGWFFGKGILVILEPEQELNPKVLIDILIKEKITHVNFVPSMLAVLVDYLEGQVIESALKYIFVAGEAFSLELAKKTREIFRTPDIINLYGPTEASVYTTWHNFIETEDKMLIGKPLPNVQVYILDQNLQPVPIGVVGELFISGRGLAKGYINQPALTNEKFIAHCFIKGEKMYKTGDLVRYLPHGHIEFIGRCDTQVKLRGFRIELGEIENVIKKIKGIKDAVVLLKKINRNEDCLVAYFVPDQSVQELLYTQFQAKIKMLLKNTVPYYMVPQHFVCLTKFPINSNGKLDKNALPTPIIGAQNISEIVAPENDLEQKLLKIWKNLLNIDDIGITTDFFDLGGHSLKVIELYSKLLKDYDVKINDIYEARTIKNLAKKITPKDNNIKQLLEKTHKLINHYTKIQDTIFSQRAIYKNDIQSELKNISVKKIKEYTGILLTGVTGFLGNYLLKMLLENTEAHIYLLIRGKNIKEAEERIKDKVKLYHQNDFLSKYAGRLTLLCGDLVKIRFSLSEKQYNFLLKEVDCIINCAAMVKHYGEYDKFYKANVKSVDNLIKFSTQNKKKDLHHMSTVSVVYAALPEEDNVSILSEKRLQLSKNASSENHYIYTKALAEELIEDARKNKGLIANIYRLGNVTFCSKTGNFQENLTDNAVVRTLSSFLALKKMPLEERITFDFTYIDCVSEIIKLLFNKEGLLNRNFNIQNPNKLSISELAHLFKKRNSDMQLMSISKFFDYLVSISSNPGNNNYFNNLLTHLYNPDLWGKNVYVFNDGTTYLLNKMSFKWRKFNFICENSLNNIINRSMTNL